MNDAQADCRTKRFTVDGVRLYSLHQLNELPTAEKEAIYRHLLPTQLLQQMGIDPQTLTDAEGNRLVTFTCLEGSRLVEVDVRPSPGFRDPLLYVELCDTRLSQIEVLLFVVNDPTAERFETDRDWRGERTKFGTTARNIPAEIAAMEAGLAPGQVRKGLGLTRTLVPIFECFVQRLGHEYYLMEPLGYHSAVLFERVGCNYVQGLQRMKWIHQAFLPGGPLHEKLDGSTPFRQPEAWRSVRGRSWAIHDGVLGEPWHGIRMYKRVGQGAGINTTPETGY